MYKNICWCSPVKVVLSVDCAQSQATISLNPWVIHVLNCSEIEWKAQKNSFEYCQCPLPEETNWLPGEWMNSSTCQSSQKWLTWDQRHSVKSNQSKSAVGKWPNMVLSFILSSPPLTHSLLTFCLKLDSVPEYFISIKIVYLRRRFKWTITSFSPLGGRSASERRRPDPAAETWRLFACAKKKKKSSPSTLKKTLREACILKNRTPSASGPHACASRDFTRLARIYQHGEQPASDNFSDIGWREADAPLFTGPLTFLRKPPSSWHSSLATTPDTRRNNWVVS